MEFSGSFALYLKCLQFSNVSRIKSSNLNIEVQETENELLF